MKEQLAIQQIDSVPRRVRVWVVPSLLACFLLIGCGPPFFGSTDMDPAASVKGEVELTAEQPSVAVEFEASFVSLRREDGIVAQLWQVQPDSRGGDVTVRESHWDGSDWVDGDDPAIAGIGLNSFRFRWVIELRGNLRDATIPIEAYLFPSWAGGSDAPAPDDSDIGDATLEIVSIYPAEIDI
jgi:hypothetical protein